MMFSNDRTELDALQQMIAGVIQQHPEYHGLLEQEAAIARNYHPAEGEANPFLHMSMHIALIEQISTNRPEGIRDCHASLSRTLGSVHEAEHRMMDCLSEAIWKAQRNNTIPDEAAYLACLKNLVEND